jgi:hypothetical protein
VSGAATHNAVVSDVRFVETIRLPQPYLGGFVAYAVIATVGLTVLWSGASLPGGQRVLLGVALVGCAAFLFLAPLHLIAMQVVVDDEALNRRVGHRRRRIALSDVTATRIEPGGGKYGVDRVVLTLLDGSDYPVATRRARELASKIQPWPAPG